MTDAIWAGSLTPAHLLAIALVLCASCLALGLASQKRLRSDLDSCRTRLSECEQRLQENQSHLEASRRDLESCRQLSEKRGHEVEEFMRIASHDLREPLRKIAAFGDRLRSRSGDLLDEEGQDHLSRMQAAAAHLQDMLDDLLELSRMSTRAAPFDALDLTRTTREALALLKDQVDETRALVDLGELPTLEADSRQMRRLLMELLSNALKFHKPGEAPVVRVFGQPDPERPSESCQLVVQDEGLGFEEKYVDRIFEPFQRLHGKGVHPGTGMGLTLCRKVARRHGGTITASSLPGHGATFTVTLPWRQPEAGRGT